MSYKLSFWIVLFLFFFEGMANLLAMSGTAAWLSIDPDLCAQQLQAQGALNGYETGSGAGSTLFGMYNAVAAPLEIAFNDVFTGAAMVKCAGVPTYLVNFTYTGLALVPGRDLASFFRSG